MTILDKKLDWEKLNHIKENTKVQGEADKNSVVTSNFDRINPENIDDYISQDGYFGLYAALFDLGPENIVQEIKDAKLRGRAGSLTLTGEKWEKVRKNNASVKYIICNANEADSNAYKDQAILEKDPHRIIEAMIIAAYAVEANIGYIYLPYTKEKIIQVLDHAIEEAKIYGLVGKNILGSDFDFEIEIKINPGSAISGEKTALLECLEGKAARPRSGLYEAEYKGLWNFPTLIDNVETLANVPNIIRDGADSFKKLGTEDIPGSKLFCLSGYVKEPALIEVPFGTSFQEILQDHVEDMGQVKALQIGGSLGAFLPAEKFSSSLDLKDLEDAGLNLGAGSIVVLDQEVSMVDLGRYAMTYACKESCGKCVPCREGTKRLEEILLDISQGEKEDGQKEKLEKLSMVLDQTSLCQLGVDAAKPIQTLLQYFPEEI